MVRAAGARRAAGCEGRQLGDARLVEALRMTAGSQARYRVGSVRSGNDERTRRALAGDGFRLDARHVLARLRDEQLVEAFRFGGRTCVGKGGAISLLAAGIKSELGNDEHLARYIGERKVRLACLVFEDAHLRDFAPQLVDLRFGVVRADAEQDEQPGADGADGSSIDIDLGVGDSLDKGAHGCSFGFAGSE